MGSCFVRPAFPVPPRSTTFVLSGWPGWSSSSWSENIRPERVYATALVVDSGRAASLQESGGRRHYLIVACCTSLRKTRMHPSLHHRRPDVSHPISLLPLLTTALPISPFAGGCQSCGRGMQAAAASIPDNITLPALSPPRHSGTPRRAAPRRILAHPYLVLVLVPKAASVQSQTCASTPCLPRLALPCLASTPHLLQACTLLAGRRRQQHSTSSSSSSPPPPAREAP